MMENRYPVDILKKTPRPEDLKNFLLIKALTVRLVISVTCSFSSQTLCFTMSLVPGDYVTCEGITNCQREENT